MTSQDLAKRGPSGITQGIEIDQAAVLRHLGLDASDPAAQALVLTCQRYDLDPILKHALLIEKRLYVTRDGLLHVAHKSGQLNGIELLEQDETDSHFVAKVAVYRKDMDHPFVYIGRFPKMRDKFEWKSNSAGKRFKSKTGEEPHPYGPEMAVKCAEAMALRRAFDVSVSAADEMWDRVDIIEESSSVGQTAVTGPATSSGGDPVRSDDRGSGEGATPSAASSPDDPPLAGDRPCPDCGHEVNPNTSSNSRAPKWKCSNESCTGSRNSKSGQYEPWVSWSTNPWKPGGEVEQAIKASSSETGSEPVPPGSSSPGRGSEPATEAPSARTTSVSPSSQSVEGGGNRSDTQEAAPNDTAPSDRQESSPGAESSTRDGSHLFSILEQAWESGVVTLGQAIRAAMGPCGRAGIDHPPSTKREFGDLPDSVLADIVEDLKLEQRLPV